MDWKVLIAHAEGEEDLAERLAGPIRDAGYEVAHRGTVVVGESVVEEASKVLSTGGPVVLCGTVKAVGTGWAHRLVNAARQRPQVRVFAVQMEKDAYVQMLSLDGTVALYWQDPAKAMRDLISSLEKYYPLEADSDYIPFGYDAEERYRELALESCDIIDLANLPESDRHIATRHLELRRLYVPLRVRVEIAPDTEAGEAELEALEKRRAAALWGRAGRGEREADRARVPVGERLAEARRLVVLGDPGSGKTTMVRWIATAYLLRLKQDPDWKDLPDVATLPDEDWLPIIVRCRDLDPSCLGGPLDNILLHTLRKAEMTEVESTALQAILREKLRQGEALLLLDGLDEVADPSVRAGFCRQLEQIHIAYPDAPIIATSRIVGYREMGYRIGRGFEHVTIADLSKEDKDDFARRWCTATEPPGRRETATEELINDIHSTDRIERLTGNPMLLTTLALVKRKVGKLPNRRADLYWEAVQVLLNWRSEVDEPIDHREAVPQLEYVAYAMCDRGVQQLREDEILDLFEGMREEYPNVRPAQEHTPEEFLRLLERRTGILVEAGHVRHYGRPVPVFEFRHLTFQEYLAGLALVDGKFPSRDRSRSLAEHIAPLAGRTSKVEVPQSGEREVAVVENWREALRLCVASCNDDDVDSVLLAILNPLEGEAVHTTARPRAVLAASCLADEPNASEETVQAVLRAFAGQVGEKDGSGEIRTSVDAAAMESAASRWAETLRSLLVEEFRRRDAATRGRVGGLCGMVAAASTPRDEAVIREWLTGQTSRIASSEEAAAIDAALGVMELTYEQAKAYVVPGMTNGLLAMLAGSAPAAHAAAWALAWLSGGDREEFDNAWRPSAVELEQFVSFVGDPATDTGAVRFLIFILGREREARAVEPLIARLEDQDNKLRRGAARVLGQIGDTRAVEPLIARLEDEGREVRAAVAKALVQIGDARAVEPLIARLEDEDRGVQGEVAKVLGQIGDARAVEPLIARLEDEDRGVQGEVAKALGQIGDARAVEPLIARLEDQESDVRRAALGALSLLMCEDEMDRKLLASYFVADLSFLDPQEEIDEGRVRQAAKRLRMPADEVRRRYEALAQQFPLKLAWQASS